MKEKMQKLIAEKRAQEAQLKEALINGETKEERAAIGETLAKLAQEIADCEAMLVEMDEPAENSEEAPEGEGERKLNVAETIEIRNGGNIEMNENNKVSEYRSAWLKKMQGIALNETEARDLAAANSVIPVETQNEVITKVKELVPLLNEVQLLNVAGSVKFAVEGTVGDAALHSENAAIDGASDTLVTVSLDGYEIVKLLRISATVKTMSIASFESWLTEQLARKVAEKIENYIINGNGSSQPKGIDYAATWTDGTNAVDWSSTKPTYAEVIELVSYLPSRFARNAKFVMNRKTLWGDIMAIRDDGKYPICKGEGAGVYNIMGYPVLLSDFVPDGDIFFGDCRMIVANLADEIKVDSSEASGFAYNAIDYRGTAIFDCDIADAAAFVKGAASL